MLRLFRNRDLMLLISGQAVSQVGDGIFMVAIAWRVFQSYSSPAALSIVGIAYMLPRVGVTIAGSLFLPAEQALLPQLVEADDLAAANSLRTMVSPLSFSIAGFALGGALTAAFGPSAAFLVDAGTFGVSVLTLLLMEPRPVTPTSGRSSMLGDAREGFRYVAGPGSGGRSSPRPLDSCSTRGRIKPWFRIW